MLGLLSMALLLITIQVCMRITFPDWQSRLDIILVLAFIQFVVAMFLPLVIRGMEVVQPSQKAYGWGLLRSILCFAMIAACAYGIRKISKFYFGDKIV